MKRALFALHLGFFYVFSWAQIAPPIPPLLVNPTVVSNMMSHQFIVLNSSSLTNQSSLSTDANNALLTNSRLDDVSSSALDNGMFIQSRLPRGSFNSSIQGLQFIKPNPLYKDIPSDSKRPKEKAPRFL